MKGVPQVQRSVITRIGSYLDIEQVDPARLSDRAPAQRHSEHPDSASPCQAEGSYALEP